MIGYATLACLMEHKSIGHYSAQNFNHLSCTRIAKDGISHWQLSGNSMPNYHPKSFSEKKPEPLVLSDVVWRACQAVEKADRKWLCSPGEN